jgi:Ca2+-binding RTX toxin-like protein
MPNRDRSVHQGIGLPTELDVPLPVLVVASDPTQETDTLNVFSDGSIANDTGLLRNPLNTTGLTKDYGQAVTATDFGNISGLNMGGNVTEDFGEGGAHDIRTYEGGVTYHNVEIVDTMLGQGNDTFTVNATTAGSVTVVQGGGGNDHLFATGGGGANAPLVLFGDTSQDGSFYNSTTANLTGNAREYLNPGNNTLDAHLDPNAVVMYGGPGVDTITGGGGGDWIAGGGGGDIIQAGTGKDDILGDDGFNLDLSKRLSLSSQVLLVANAPAPTDEQKTHDALAAGNNTITGGASDDIIVGTHGIITQTAGTKRITTTGQVIGISTTRVTDFGNNTIFGGQANDIILGGSVRTRSGAARARTSSSVPTAW